MMRKLSCVLLTLALLLTARLVMAQTGGEPDHITRWTVNASAGGTLSSSNFKMAGSVAQISTDISASPNRYATGGIWPPHYIHPWPIITTLPGIDPIDPAEDVVDPNVPPVDLLETIEGEYNFPSTLGLPGCPDLDVPTFPSTLGLPDMPSLTLSSYITSMYSPIIELTEAIVSWDQVITSSLFLSDELRDAMGAGSGNLGDIELAGYTADEMVTELVTGIDTAFSYLRSITTIGIIGPTATALILGISWIFFVAFVKILVRTIFATIHLIVELWRLLPFT